MPLLTSEKIGELLQKRIFTFIFCLACVAIMGLNVRFMPPFMIAWGIFWIIENIFGSDKTYFMIKPHAFLFLLFLIFFLWQLSGLLLTDSLTTGLERMVKRLSFILFPLVLFLPGKRIIDNIDNILRLFVFCLFIYIVFCFGNALANSISVIKGVYFFNSHPADYTYESFFFSSRFSLLVHPTYLSMYVVISILISLESLFDNSLKFYIKVFFIAIIILFIVVIYLLSSRAGLLAAVIVLPMFFLVKYFKNIPRWILFSGFIVMVVILLRIAWTNDRLNYNMDGITKSDPKEILKNDIRYNIWKSAIDVIGQNLLLGVGTGDASEELKKEFMNKGYSDGFYNNLNAHNQFLEILLENGLIGLLLFLTVFGYMMYISITTNNHLVGLFVITMIIMFMFETMLNRLAGITFFPLFSFLLIHFNPKNKI